MPHATLASGSTCVKCEDACNQKFLFFLYCFLLYFIIIIYNNNNKKIFFLFFFIIKKIISGGSIFQLYCMLIFSPHFFLPPLLLHHHINIDRYIIPPTLQIQLEMIIIMKKGSDHHIACCMLHQIKKEANE